MSRLLRPPPSQIKVVTREFSDAAAVQVNEVRCRSATRKSGATYEQICGQAFDAGNVRGGADRGAPAHRSPCRGWRQSGAASAAGIGLQQGKEEKRQQLQHRRSPV